MWLSASVSGQMSLTTKEQLSHGIDSFSLLTIWQKRVGASPRASRPGRPDRLVPEIINSHG